MPRELLLLMFLFAIHFDANGQCQVGLTGGINYSSYYDKSDTPHFSGSYDSPLTYRIEAFFRTREKNKLNGGVSLSYVKKELDWEIGYGGLGAWFTRKDHISFDYLYVTVFPEFVFGNKFKVGISIGATIGVMLSSKMSGTYDFYTINGGHISAIDGGNANDEFNQYELRLHMGCSFEIPVNSKFSIAINNSYDRGATNSIKSGYDTFLSSNDIASTLGIVYKIEKEPVKKSSQNPLIKMRQ